MNHYVGIDVSLEASSVCVVDGNGQIVREGKIVSKPDALIAWLGGLKLELTRIGLEAGPLSQWLYAAMRHAGLAVELLETRHVRNALKTMPVRCSPRASWCRVKLHDIEMSLRGILRGFGLKVGTTTPARFEGRIRELVAGHPSLEAIAQGLLAVRVALRRQFDRFEKQVLAVARCDTRARLLMSVPGVGAIVSLTFAAAIDDPARFESSKQVGPYFGLTPTKYQSGQTDIDGRISKIGDAGVRAVLYEAANIILIKPLKGFTALKSWAMKLARRSGMKKAKVALARKIAVIMHRMLADGMSFRNAAAV
jgi:transposase